MVTRWIGFSEVSSSLPIGKEPPGIDTISGIGGGVIGGTASIPEELSLGASTGARAGAGTVVGGLAVDDRSVCCLSASVGA
jgi:hypothetical protein